MYVIGCLHHVTGTVTCQQESFAAIPSAVQQQQQQRSGSVLCVRVQRWELCARLPEVLRCRLERVRCCPHLCLKICPYSN